MMCIIKEGRFNIFCRMGLFPLSYPVFQNSTIPSFHAAYQKNGRKKHCDSNKLYKFRYILYRIVKLDCYF
jgi:hypothetical protein